jgi:NTE family protein
MVDANCAPVHDTSAGTPQEGWALCLSGGGYRAMMFHAGCLWRLNDAGMLAKLNRVSSVSGGSITAGVLGMNWYGLDATPGVPSPTFQELVISPLRKIAAVTIDEGSILGGVFLPGSISDHVSEHYDKLLFDGKTLQDLPDDSAPGKTAPRFVINATNVQSGVLMRFSRPYMRDYRVGQIKNPRLPLAKAVAASSAFPPVLSLCEIDISKYGLRFEPSDGTEDLNISPYTEKLVLSDGGVYDNLGLETAWKHYDTILVSDGGGHYRPEPSPHHDWARHALRVLDLIDSQVRSLRTRDLITLFRMKERDGAYWGIRQDTGVYPGRSALNCPLGRTTELAQYPTRLQKMDDEIQERLINWGYSVCDAAVRSYFDPSLPQPAQFPYPRSGV